jgi:basic amino acid/polyamine antiporter, APA family
MSLKPSLKLMDATLIVAGSMIGSGIFIVAADMGRTVGCPGGMLLLWLIAGIMTIFAALSYGELASMFPKAGGQYVYLKEAFNPLVGFLYGWTLFTVIQSGTIAAVAVAFAKYTGILLPVFSEKNILLEIGSFKINAAQLLGIASVVALTLINSRGIQYGKIIVRFFTSAKLLALFGLIILGLFIFRNETVWQQNLSHFWDFGHYQKNETTGTFSFSSLMGMGLLSAIGGGLVGSLFSCDAWNNVTFITGDIEKPERNIPLSLVYGTVMVILIYLLVNVAYLNLLPFAGDVNATTALGKGIIFADQDRVGTAAAGQIFGNQATIIMAVLIMISAFGCNNGIILSSVRVYQTMAMDKLFFSKMKENNKNGVPGNALWIQCLWASVLCLSGKYGELLDYVIFAVIIFYILTIIGIFILRKKQPNTPRPYKAFGYPLIPILYILLALAFCINLIFTKPMYTFPGLLIVLLGVPVYYFWERRNAVRVQNQDGV